LETQGSRDGNNSHYGQKDSHIVSTESSRNANIANMFLMRFASEKSVWFAEGAVSLQPRGR
jgi:hypothetical protein